MDKYLKELKLIIDKLSILSILF